MLFKERKTLRGEERTRGDYKSVDKKKKKIQQEGWNIKLWNLPESEIEKQKTRK